MSYTGIRGKLARKFSPLLIGLSCLSANAMATDVTLIQVSDLHGNMVPHAGIIEGMTAQDTRAVTQGGGIAKVATIIKDIRAAKPNHLTLGVGDTIHGSAEVLFTMGDAMMPAVNALGLDAYTPGNWEFAYGPAVFRHRFVGLCQAHPEWQNPPQVNPLCPPLPANVREMVDSDGIPGVTKANFPTLAINVYNGGPYPLFAPFYGKRTMLPYKVFDRAGVKIGVIGITAAITPQQPPVFGRTMSFSQGVKELPEMIAAAKADGAKIIVVQSELGLPQNVQIGREFPEVDVILSAHSHEVTHGALLADANGFEQALPNQVLTGTQLARLQKGAAIVVEAGEDLYVGQLDLTIADGKVQNFVWNAIPVDDSVAEDPEVKALVDAQEKFFVAGPDFKTHTFLPAAFCDLGGTNPCGRDADGVVRRGLRLVDPLDIVVGNTEVLLHRHEAIEGVMNNFIADAFRSTLASAAHTAAGRNWANLDVLSMTNGFRFDTVVLPANMVGAGQAFRDGREPGEVTLRDLWSYFPVPPALTAADFNGFVIEENLNNILGNVFHPNPYIQRGGWYLGLSSNMSQMVDVVNLPMSTSGTRIIETRINNKLIDPSKRYVIASCYGHTFALGRSCRAEGGANMVFYTLQDPEDYTSPIGLADPKVSEGLIDNKTPGSPIRRAAPDNYMHPIHAMRRFLDQVGTITEAEFGVGRVKHVDVTHRIDANGDGKFDTFLQVDVPHSNIPGIVQPIDGVGPSFLERNITVSK